MLHWCFIHIVGRCSN